MVGAVGYGRSGGVHDTSSVGSMPVGTWRDLVPFVLVSRPALVCLLLLCRVGGNIGVWAKEGSRAWCSRIDAPV
jgi:hypothetical protein